MPTKRQKSAAETQPLGGAYQASNPCLCVASELRRLIGVKIRPLKWGLREAPTKRQNQASMCRLKLDAYQAPTRRQNSAAKSWLLGGAYQAPARGNFLRPMICVWQAPGRRLLEAWCPLGNIQSLAIELFKVVNRISPEIMKHVFPLKETVRYSNLFFKNKNSIMGRWKSGLFWTKNMANNSRRNKKWI